MLQIYYIIYVTRRNPPVSDLIQYKSPSCPHWNIIGLLSERKTTEDKNTNCDSAAAPRFILSTCGPVMLQHLDVLYLYVCRVTGTEEERMFTGLVSGRRHDNNTQVWFSAVPAFPVTFQNKAEQSFIFLYCTLKIIIKNINMNKQ